MNRKFRIQFLVFLLFGPPAWACDTARAISQLRQKSPEGYALYQKINNIPAARKTFTTYLSSSQGGCDVTTALHEGAHIAGAPENSNRYHLISGQLITRVPETSRLFKPKEIYPQVQKTDLSNTYLSGRMPSSSTEYFDYLLDEFNSYAWDAKVSHQLGTQLEADGLLEFMQFVSTYIDHAKKERPESWEYLKSEPTRSKVAALWSQAHDIIGELCQTGKVFSDSAPAVTKTCRAAQSSSLELIVGAKAACPASCRQKASASNQVTQREAPKGPIPITEFRRKPKATSPPAPVVIPSPTSTNGGFQIFIDDSPRAAK